MAREPTSLPPPSSSRQQHRIHRESYLLKQAKWRFVWDRRFFIQDGVRLAYRVVESGPEKNAGYISSLQSVVGPKKSLEFCVWLKEGDCWRLRAETEEEHRQWTDSITAALLKDAAEESVNVRETVALKKSAWTGEWRERYFELDGYMLTYRERKESGVRSRYVLLAVDGAGEEKGEEDSIFLTTSCGERFWIKFANTEECEDWKGVIIKSLQQTVSWNWMSVVPSHAAEYAPLRVQYHATAVAGGGRFVYCYGGTSTQISSWQCCVTSGESLPVVKRGNVGRQLSRIQLAGEHRCIPLDILPFEESEHAKLRPPPLVGAALCVVKTTTSSSPSLSTCGAPASTPDCLLLVGGRGETFALRESTVEVWWLVLKDTLTQWQRAIFDADVLPHRTFHTLTARGPKEAVLIGGMDNLNRVRDECFLISWQEDSAVKDFLSRPVIEFIDFLPIPLAFHVCLLLRDKSLLVLGGRGIGGDAQSGSVFRLSSAELKWQEVMVEPPLPRLDHVCATNVSSSSLLYYTEDVELVFILGETKEQHSTSRLFQLTLRSTNVTSREILFSVGAIPRHCCGAKLHHMAGYLYLLGGCEEETTRNDTNETMFLRDPLRMLICCDIEGGGETM